MKKINYDEFVEKLKQMQIGDTFNFYEEYDAESNETSHAYGVGVVSMFDATMIIINYYGGGLPFIVDVTLPDYEIDHDNLHNYFRECRNGFKQTEFVYVDEND